MFSFLSSSDTIDLARDSLLIMFLLYPTYKESKKRFKKAHKTLKTIPPNLDKVDENATLEKRIEFVKAFQEFSNSYEYNDDMEKSKVLQEQVMTIVETVGGLRVH